MLGGDFRIFKLEVCILLRKLCFEEDYFGILDVDILLRNNSKKW